MENKTFTGTSNFVSLGAARKYYGEQGYSQFAVDQKIKEKAIKIGLPKLAKGQKLMINKEEGRYFISG